MKPRTSLSTLMWTAALFLTLVLASPLALAARPPGVGGGGGAGGGSGGGGGAEAPDLGDMWVLYRDADGVPILTDETTVTDPETGLPVDGGLCQQPLAAPGVTLVNAVSGATACTPTSSTESCVIPVDPLTCAIVVGLETYVQEVDFGRMNVARAPASVMDRQLEDLLVTLSTAQCLALDPAGRLVYLNPDTADADGDGDTEEIISNEVDSPIQNLVIYREMMTKGALGDPPIALPRPAAIAGYGLLDTAAKGLGAASDKGGKIDVDLVVYLNQILGLPDLAPEQRQLDTRCISHRAEVQGQMQLVEKCFLDYSGHRYARSDTYGHLPFPAYIPGDDPQEGAFEYLALYPDLTGPDGQPLFWIASGPILSAVFDGGEGFTDGDIGGFAQASDDARAVIDFMHSNPVLEGYGAPVQCSGGPPPAVSYDVALSTLQMPIRMVGGTEREGTVTVINNGPDAASGTVAVTGTDTRGATWTFTETFTGLGAGATQSWTLELTELTGPTYATTITWRATVSAPADILASNNTLTATTQVTRPRGRRGSGEGE